jgi:hypothetical protein
MDSSQRSEKKRSRIRNLLRAMRSSSDVHLTKDEAASTFFRFFRSKHVDDLRFIVKTAFFCFAAFCTVVIIAQASTAAMQTWWPPTASVTAQGPGAAETESFKVKGVGTEALVGCLAGCAQGWVDIYRFGTPGLRRDHCVGLSIGVCAAGHR